MSLKVKLTSTICAFLLILGLVITGVFAVPQATVNLGGTLTFKASDVYARVTGTITGSKEDPILTPIEFNAGSASDTSTWTNNLAFKDDGSTITITINVENLATDRPLYVSITDTLGYVANIDKDLTNGAFELAAGEDATATITLDIADKNASLSGASYGYSVELLDESAVQSYDAVEGLTFTCDTNAKTASVTGNSVTAENGNIVIPAYVKSGDVVCAVTSIGIQAFDSCIGLTSIKIPDGVTSIGAAAFQNCSSLTSINIPKGVTSIDEVTFWSCSGLKSIEIPNNVTSIGYGAFYGCSGLTSIIIPERVTNIGSDAFEGCTELKTVTIDSESIATVIDGAPSSNGLLLSKATTINIKEGLTITSYVASLTNAGTTVINGVTYNVYTK